MIKQERARKRFTKMLPSMEGLGCKERLDRVGLFSLEQRRLKVDFIEVYKIMMVKKVDGHGLFPHEYNKGV